MGRGRRSRVVQCRGGEEDMGRCRRSRVVLESIVGRETRNEV
jgi:hypothetical protein